MTEDTVLAYFFYKRSYELAELLKKENLNAKTSIFKRIKFTEITEFPILDIDQLQLYMWNV